MDWSSLYLKYYDFDRACLPGDMARACSLSLILFPRASARCKISSHKIEKLLNDDIRMMWLLQNQTPSSKTINRFRVNPKADALLTSLVHCINGT
ncbi:transposase [Staphylococcus cohnii]|nr:hypothetical protein [Staphylococcus cohnii subsp. barensis]